MAVVTILNDGTIEETADLLAQMLATRAAAAGPRSGGWQQQFVSALQCEGSVDHLGNHLPPTRAMMMLHFLSIFWKVLFATIPPARYCGGWLSFTVSLVYIAMLTAVIGDAAGQLGCAVRLGDLGASERRECASLMSSHVACSAFRSSDLLRCRSSSALMLLTPLHFACAPVWLSMFFSCRVSVTAVTLVAVGTSLPDLLASKQAATDSTNADAAVGNVTGSNSVNVFLGLGLPWLLASVYYAMNGQRFCYPVSAD